MTSIEERGDSCAEAMESDEHRLAALFNDVSCAPLPIAQRLRLSDRESLACYLWEQGWHRVALPAPHLHDLDDVARYYGVELP